MTKRGGAEASLMAFDLLLLDGEDLRLWPLEARREALTRLALRRTDACGWWARVPLGICVQYDTSKRPG